MGDHYSRHQKRVFNGTRRDLFRAGAVAGLAGTAAATTQAQAAIKAPHKMEALEPDEEFWGFCDMCYWRCGLKIRSRDGKAFKIDGNKDHPNNRGVVCAKGNAGIMLANDPDRLKHPMLRVGPRGEAQFQRISWDEALDRVAENFTRIKKEMGAQALALIGHGTWEKPYHRLMHALGTPNTTSPVFGLCCGPRGVSNLMVTGRNLTGNETYDLENCKYFLMMGRNVTESLHNGETLGWVDGVANGAKVVYADPRYSITASKADEWLAIRPLTDHAFLLAMIHEVVYNELYDKEFIEEYAIGLNELKRAVKKYTPEWQEELTQIPAETVRRIASEMAEAAPSVLVYAPRRNTRTTNDLGVGLSISILNSLFGVWDRKGGIYTPQVYSIPEPDLPPFPHAHAAKPEGGGDFDFSNPNVYTDEGEYQRADGAGVIGRWPIANAQYGLTNEMWRAIAHQKPYPIKGLLTAGGNGFMQSTDPAEIKQALMNLDFFVATDVMPNEMNAYADIILPEASYLERYDDLQIGGAREGYVALREPAMKPMHDTMGSWDICKKLADRMGLSDYFPHNSVEELLEDRLGKAGLSLSQLREKGIIKKPADDRVNFPREFGLKSKFQTPSGKLELMPSPLKELGLMEAIHWEEQPRPDGNEFHLTIGRVGYHTHARTQNNQWLIDFMPENLLWMHPDAAAKRGIVDGDRVRISDRKERRQLIKVKVTNRIRPDTVFMVHGFGHWDKRMSVAAGRGGSDAVLASTDQDKRIGTASMGLSMVRVEKA